jgi:restriction endonuclease S subunit
MEVIEKTYLKSSSFQLLQNWSVRYLLESRFSYNEKFELVPIGSFLKKSRNRIKLENGKLYQRVTVKINNGGVIPRDTELGENIGTKIQYEVNPGQFLLSKIDARNGAFGLVPPTLDGAIVTNDFPVFNVDKTKINPEFLVLITTTKEFIQFAQSCSSGTTNRQRIDIEKFLNVNIPLPSLSEQNRIFEAYNKKINQAEELKKKAKKLEEEIQNFLLEELGLEKVTIKQFKKGVINLFSFSNAFDRWDIHKDSSASLASLKQTKYPLMTLDDAFEFEKRGWEKSEHDSDYFNYIEIGAVDPLKGITENKRILVKKAPSRATQIIKTGDLIIGTTRPYLKRFAIVTEQFNNNIASSGFQVITPSENYNLEYLLEYLKSDYGIKQFELFMTGALYPAITSKDLKKIKIPIPPFSIQNEIAKKIKDLKNEIHDLKQNSQNLKFIATKEFENEIFQQVDVK